MLYCQPDLSEVTRSKAQFDELGSSIKKCTNKVTVSILSEILGFYAREGDASLVVIADLIEHRETVLLSISMGA